MSGSGVRVTLALAAMIMVSGLSIPASAADIDIKSENNGGTNNDTKVFIGVSKEIPTNVSFEVPLYYTMAVTASKEDGKNNQVLLPEGYYIENRTEIKDADGNVTGLQPLAVSKMRVQGLENGVWDLVDNISDPGTEDKREMEVSIGGVKLPALKAGAIRTIVDADLKQPGSQFMKEKDGEWVFQTIGDIRWNPYDPTVSHNKRMDLDVQVKIPEAYKPSQVLVNQVNADGTVMKDKAGNTIKKLGTVAQFKVMYTLTPLDEKGDPISTYDKTWVRQHYEGPYNEAGTTN